MIKGIIVAAVLVVVVPSIAWAEDLTSKPVLTEAAAQKVIAACFAAQETAAYAKVNVVVVDDGGRSFAILLALGASPRQLGAFLWSEALLVYIAGMGAGFGIGVAMAWVLVKLMTQVFDPPPETLYVPWGYLFCLALVGLAATAVSVIVQLRKPTEPLSFSVRNL
jgi:predicted lysophospholipase L1 biosynthesis ABC-type transport system permease subunit